MKNKRVDVSSVRRQQIVDAAIAVITEKGIQKLSLSAIEKKTGMARGQLTYYFHSKEDIFLAVFDRLIQVMHEHAEGKDVAPHRCAFEQLRGWERMKVFLTWIVLNPPTLPGFEPLQYTFLAQISHRADFRERLAKLYDRWRGHMAGNIGDALTDGGRDTGVSPRTVATLVQAILHGLAIQRAADPNVYDREEMLRLIFDVLGNYLGQGGAANETAAATNNAKGTTNGAKSKGQRLNKR